MIYSVRDMRFKPLRFFTGAVLSFAAAFLGAHLLLAAQPSTNSAVYLSRPIVSTSTSLAFTFLTGINLPADSSITLTLDPAFTVPASASPSDGVVTVGGSTQSVAAVSGPGVYGYEKTGNIYRVTLPTDTAISANSNLEILLGRDLGIISPSATGSYQLIAKFYDAANQYLGGVAVVAVIVRPIGVSASTEAGNPQIRVVRLKPEKRVGAPYTNDAAPYFVSVRYGQDFFTANPSTTAPRGAVIYSQPNLSQAAANGTDSTPITLSGLIDTSYDIGIKTDQHLTRILRNVPLVDATTTDLNFTDPNNGPVDAGQVLLAGDINGPGGSPSGFGDDVVNSIDLSILILGLDAPDLSHSAYRANLNKDDVVNSVDLSIMLKNLDVEGDR